MLLETIRTFVYSLFLSSVSWLVFPAWTLLINKTWRLFLIPCPCCFCLSTQLRIINSFEILPEKSYITNVVKFMTSVLVYGSQEGFYDPLCIEPWVCETKVRNKVVSLKFLKTSNFQEGHYLLCHLMGPSIKNCWKTRVVDWDSFTQPGSSKAPYLTHFRYSDAISGDKFFPTYPS